MKQQRSHRTAIENIQTLKEIVGIQPPPSKALDVRI
jgi:hypothetical protein